MKTRDTRKLSVSHDDLFEGFIIDGQYAAGDSNHFEAANKIPWLDLDMAQAGQAFFQRHYLPIIFAHSLYFGLGFGFKPITGVVFQTRGFRGLERTMKRVLSTIWHVVSWYENDMIGPSALGSKAVGNVRKTHGIVRKKCPLKLIKNNNNGKDGDSNELDPKRKDYILEALKADMNFLDTSTLDRMNLTYDPPQDISQFTLAITQISFVLPVMVHPEGFGIWDTTGAEAFEHLWALIGRQLGLEDRFNIPLHRPGKEFYLKVYKEVYVASFLVRDYKINAIQESYFSSSNAFMPSLSVAGSFYLFLKQTKLEGFRGDEIYKLMNLTDKISCVLYRLVFLLFSLSATLNMLINYIVRSSMQSVLKKYTQEKPELVESSTNGKWSEIYHQVADKTHK